MISIRNAAALPLLLVAICLWALADSLAKLSKKAGDGAARIMATGR